MRATLGRSRQPFCSGQIKPLAQVQSLLLYTAFNAESIAQEIIPEVAFTYNVAAVARSLSFTMTDKFTASSTSLISSATSGSRTFSFSNILLSECSFSLTPSLCVSSLYSTSTIRILSSVMFYNTPFSYGLPPVYSHYGEVLAATLARHDFIITE